MIEPARQPLDQLREHLAEVIAAGDTERLARLLQGYDLPALGGHQTPADILLQAVHRPPSDLDFVAGFTRLLAETFRQEIPLGTPEAQLNVAKEDILFNGLVLATELPPDRLLFDEVKTLGTRLRQVTSQTPGRPGFGSLLRRSWIYQQVDDSLENYWFELIDTVCGDADLTLSDKDRITLLDAWRGILWIPYKKRELPLGQVVPLDRVKKGIAHLRAGLAGSQELTDILLKAKRLLEETYPRSDQFWTSQNLWESQPFPRLLPLPPVISNYASHPTSEAESYYYRSTELSTALHCLVVTGESSRQALTSAQGERLALFGEAGIPSGVEFHLWPGRVTHQTLDSIRQAIVQTNAQVLHVMGHGTTTNSDIGTLTQTGFLGDLRPVSASALAETLRGAPSLNLVVLSPPRRSQFPLRRHGNFLSGLATTLVHRGIPSVLAMREPAMGDSSATLFARAFYENLGAGESIETAFVEARSAIQLVEPQQAEWAPPALYMRSGSRDLLLRLEGKVASGDSSYEASDLSEVIARSTANFIGRRFVFKRLEKFFRKNRRGYFFVAGEAGLGKTTLLAELIRRHGWVHHLDYPSSGLGDADAIARHLSYQLMTRYGETLIDLVQEDSRGEEMLRLAFEKIAGRIGEKLVLLIDAIDELVPAQLTPTSNPLGLPAQLPRNVYIIATSRTSRIRNTLQIDCEAEVMEIKPTAQLNISDARQLVHSRLRSPAIRHYLAIKSLKEEQFVDKLIEESSGNFSKLTAILQAIEFVE